LNLDRERVGFALLGVATAWNAGNIGPAAAAIADDLDVSLAAIGALGGTIFFAGLVAAKLGAAGLTQADRKRRRGSAQLPGGARRQRADRRQPAGFSLGLALVLGPVPARKADRGRRRDDAPPARGQRAPAR
jgi:hypothetical protein